MFWDSEDMEEAVIIGGTRGQALAVWASERGDDFTNGRARVEYVRYSTEAEIEEWAREYRCRADEAPAVQWCSAKHPEAMRCWVVMPKGFVWHRRAAA
jgi:hypothetical protein